VKIAVVFDAIHPEWGDADYKRELAEGKVEEAEYDVARALLAKGHDVLMVGIRDELGPLLERLAAFEPKLVFNGCEAFRGHARHEYAVAAVLDMHGYRHTDTAPRPRGIREWLVRRLYTDNEGEFSQLDFEMARTRILRGLVVLRSAGWHPTGFVAPAWLMSASALCALEETPLEYFATRDAVVVVRSGERIAAPSLVVSTRAAWRRALSPIWNQALLAHHATSRVVRVALHPADLRFPAMEQLWRRLFSQLEDREVVTEAQLIPPPSRRAALARDTLLGGA